MLCGTKRARKNTSLWLRLRVSTGRILRQSLNDNGRQETKAVIFWDIRCLHQLMVLSHNHRRKFHQAAWKRTIKSVLVCDDVKLRNCWAFGRWASPISRLPSLQTPDSHWQTNYPLVKPKSTSANRNINGQVHSKIQSLSGRHVLSRNTVDPAVDKQARPPPN